MTREADEQSEDERTHPGPSRQTPRANVYGNQSTLPDMGRLNLNGEVLAGTTRRRERNRKWDRNVDSSDEEDKVHPSRARARQGEEKSSIPVMEEQLARYRHMEGEAEIAGDIQAQEDAKKTIRHFERALKDAKAERDAQREQARVFRSISESSGIDISGTELMNRRESIIDRLYSTTERNTAARARSRPSIW
jgi:hypothetical protein